MFTVLQLFSFFVFFFLRDPLKNPGENSSFHFKVFGFVFPPSVFFFFCFEFKLTLYKFSFLFFIYKTSLVFFLVFSRFFSNLTIYILFYVQFSLNVYI